MAASAGNICPPKRPLGDVVAAYRRGGRLQRRRQEQEARDIEAGVPQRSHLAGRLLQLWAWGSITAKRVQELAHLALQDGLEHEDIRRLARLGNYGQHAQNAQRDLLHWMEAHLGAMPHVIHASIPLVTPHTQAMQYMDLPIVPLHRMMAHMFEHWPQEFAARLAGKTGALEGFGQNVRGADPRWLQWVPHLSARDDYLQHCIPIALHGDGVPVSRKIVSRGFGELPPRRRLHAGCQTIPHCLLGGNAI